MRRVSEPGSGRLRVGVVGCGRIVRAVHLPALRRVADVVALADPDSEALAAAASGGERLSAEVGELLAAGDVDAVVVASPSGHHAADALAVLEAGCRLYLEKPLAVTVHEGRAVVAADPAGAATIGFNRRRHPVVLVALDALESGRLGSVVAAETRFCESRQPPRAMPAWKHQRAQGGGVLLDLAIHHVDLLRHMLADEVAHVAATVHSLEVEQDDAEVRLRFAGGVEAVVTASYHGVRADTLLLHCERGTLVLDRHAGTVRMNGRTVRDRRLLPLALRRLLRSEVDPSYAAALRAFVAGEPGPSLVDGLRALEAVTAAEAAAA